MALRICGQEESGSGDVGELCEHFELELHQSQSDGGEAADDQSIKSITNRNRYLEVYAIV